MRSKQAFYTGPVPLEKHYDVFKFVEDKLKSHLESFDKDHLLVGLRVAYDEKDSSNEPGELPYLVEFGYLELVDNALKCMVGEEVSEEELTEYTKNAPIPISLLDELYEYVKTELGAATSTELNVGVFTEVKSNPIRASGVTCGCGGSRIKRYRLVTNNLTGRSRWVCRLGC
ncbi:MAG: hypothetical protein HYZ21_00315 [Chloroflexi bacterium]|nr:hypothetical protein [Chloroflexota bacterium]